jgi:alpha-beta hydrolase superfamily lysophospholipase
LHPACHHHPDTAKNGKSKLLKLFFRGSLTAERDRIGPRGKSAVINTRVFAEFNKPFAPTRTPFDWLSRDQAEVDKYIADPLCAGFRASVQLAIDVLGGLDEISRPRRQAKIPKGLPTYVIAGTRDPVGGQTRRVEQLLNAYDNAGLQDVTSQFYQDARHELFNEINRDEVTHDLIDWLHDVVGRERKQ